MLTRRHCPQCSALTAAGEAMAAEPSLAQAIRTATVGLVAGDLSITRGHATSTSDEARPDHPGRFPVVVVIAERWGRHASLREVARRVGNDNFYAMAPERFQRDGGVTHRTEVPESRKMVLHIPRTQVFQDRSATANEARGPSAAGAARVGGIGVCWGGSTTIQDAADDQARGAAGAWDGPPGRESQDAPQPVSGVDGAKDLPCPCRGLVGEEDHNPTPADVRTREALVKPPHTKVELVSSPKAGHACVADDRQRYWAEAAKAGGTRCGGWLPRS